MRFLIAGDTHGNLRHVHYLIKCAHETKATSVVVVGDFGYWEHTDAGREFLDRVDQLANIRGVTVYFLDGNHDKTSLLLARYADQVGAGGFLQVRSYIKYIPRGHSWTWDRIRFLALGGAYSIDKFIRLQQEKDRGLPPGSLWFPEEEMSDGDLHTAIGRLSGVDVILAHDKPAGSTPDRNFKDLPLCLPNQRRLQLAIRALEPLAFYHGHLHHHYAQRMEYTAARNGVPKDVLVRGLGCDGMGADSWVLFDTEVFNTP